MADNTNIKDAAGSTTAVATDELSDSSKSPKVTLLAGDSSPTPYRIDQALGSLTETAPASDTASSGLNGRLQRIAQRITSLIALLPTSLGGGAKATALRVTLSNEQIGTTGSPATDILTIQGAVASAASDAGNPVKVGGKYEATPAVATDGQRRDLWVSPIGGALALATSLSGGDGSSNSMGGLATASSTALNSSTKLQVAPSVFNGSTWDRLRGNTTGLIVIPPAGWQYAAATGGIDNTNSAVTIKAAAGAGIRNYLTSLQIDNDTLGAATEIAVRDGAGGTVLWRGKLQTAAGSRTIEFATPLVSTANTLLEFLTLTAVTGDVLVNAQGYTAP